LREEAGEDWLDERAEDDLSPTSLGKGHPEDEDKLEHVVEWEPVNGVDQALNNGEERKDNPIGQPLCIIDFARAEQSFEGVITRNQESGKVDEELAANVEEDQKEVETEQSEEDVDLGNRCLLLEVVEHRVLGQLLIDLRDLVLGFVLERHDCGSWLKLLKCFDF